MTQSATLVVPPDVDELWAELERLDTAKMPRYEWLEHRRGGIGGSDAGAIFGVDPYNSPLDVWLDKTGRVEDKDLGDVEAVLWGHLLEEPIAAEWGRRVELPVWQPARMLWHPDRPWQKANPDRLYLTPSGEVGILEVKNVGHWTSKAWEESGDDEEGIPPNYELQVLHYLAVTGCAVATIVALLGGKKLVWREIKRDDALIQDLTDVEQGFWEDHVLADVPPAIDGSEAATEALGRMFARPNGSTVMCEVEDIEIVERYWAAHRALERAKVDKAAAANELRMLMGNAEYLQCGARSVATWKGGQRRQFQKDVYKGHLDQLQALGFPEAAEHYRSTFETVETGRTLRPNQKITREDFTDG